MDFIAKRDGTFITVLPRTRKESKDFRKTVASKAVPWEEIRRDQHPRRKNGPDSVYEAYESGVGTSDGYRLAWYRSSRKTELDQKDRAKRLQRAKSKIEALENRTGRHKLRTEESAAAAARKILEEESVEAFLNVEATTFLAPSFRQIGPGRPGKNTTYERVDVEYIFFDIEEDRDAIKADADCDGIFPLVTNDEALTARELLDTYKYQPFLEKRNEQLKSILNVAPVFLKKVERVEALLFLYFLAILVFALIEREIRTQMKEKQIESLPLYPEERVCKAPTANVVFQAVEGCRRHRLLGPQGELIRTFYDDLSTTARRALRLLGVRLDAYGIS